MYVAWAVPSVPFTGQYHDSKVPGIYHCACCQARRCLTPMPSTIPVAAGPAIFSRSAVRPSASLDDFSHGMHRIEVKLLCKL